MKQKPKRDFEEIFLRDDIHKNPWNVLYLMFQDNMGKLLVSTFFFLIKSSPVYLLPLFTANVINALTYPTENTPRIIIINIILSLLFIAQNVPMHTLYMRGVSNAIRDVETRLRSALVRKLQQLSITFHKDFQSGKIQSKVLRDVEAIEGLARNILVTVLAALATGIASIGITVAKSPATALFFLLTVPLSVLVMSIFRKNIRQTNRDFRREIEQMSSNVAEMVEMIPVTKAHGLQNVEIKRLDRQLERVQEKGLKTDMVQAYFGSFTWVSFQTTQVLCLAFNAYMAYRGNIRVGDIAMYQTYFAALLGSVSSIIAVYPMLAKGGESIISISEILSSKETENDRGKKRIKSLAGDYCFDRVSFSYPDDPDALVINDFTLRVNRGECVAFVGGSGAGKSTLLNLLIGFNFPTAGALTIDGTNIKDLNLTSYRNHIAVVPQTNILFSGSIRDNITYGLSSIQEEQLQKVIDMANLRDVVNRLPNGVDTLVGEHGGRLSGGQRQRIAIARAMIRNPDVIILDEATSALDNAVEMRVQQAMNELIKGRTTFIVAHRLSTIRNADRIVVMKNGRCAEEGTYDELMAKKGEFFALNQTQAK